jgi:hypothetical protein
MADRILVALPDGRWLALDHATFIAALTTGAEMMAPSPVAAASAPAPAKLLTAHDMEAATGIPASWYSTQARERRIPFRKLGRYVRFDFDEVMASEPLQRRAIPPGQMNRTGSLDRKGRASV